jgi:cbb3-type cytochrome oxidase maturation protein
VSVVFIVLPLALLVVFAAVIAYTWAARRGQFDDLTTPAMRMLHEDGEPGPVVGADTPSAEEPDAEAGRGAPPAGGPESCPGEKKQERINSTKHM